MGRSSQYCEGMWGRHCCLTVFFRLSIHAYVAKIIFATKACIAKNRHLGTVAHICRAISSEDIARQICATVPRWRFLAIFAPCISSEPRAAHFRRASEIRTRATPCVDVWQTSNLRQLRLGEEKRKKEETTGQKYNGLPYSTGRP